VFQLENPTKVDPVMMNTCNSGL